jgi:hypothetical protein
MSDLAFPTLKSSNWKLQRTPQFTTLTQRSVSGVWLSRAALQSQPGWKWMLKNGVLQSADAIGDLQAIESLVNQMAGMYDSFLWTDSELGQQFRVAFVSDAVTFDRICYQIWQCGQLEFETVRS